MALKLPAARNLVVERTSDVILQTDSSSQKFFLSRYTNFQPKKELVGWTSRVPICNKPHPYFDSWY
jgi:hypothetical protein